MSYNVVSVASAVKTLDFKRTIHGKSHKGLIFFAIIVAPINKTC